MLTRDLTDDLQSRTEDTRDTTAFPDAEAYGQPPFVEHLIWDPKPDVRVISVYILSGMLLILPDSMFG